MRGAPRPREGGGGKKVDLCTKKKKQRGDCEWCCPFHGGKKVASDWRGKDISEEEARKEKKEKPSSRKGGGKECKSRSPFLERIALVCRKNPATKKTNRRIRLIQPQKGGQKNRNSASPKNTSQPMKNAARERAKECCRARLLFPFAEPGDFTRGTRRSRRSTTEQPSHFVLISIPQKKATNNNTVRLKGRGEPLMERKKFV